MCDDRHFINGSYHQFILLDIKTLSLWPSYVRDLEVSDDRNYFIVGKYHLCIL